MERNNSRNCKAYSGKDEEEFDSNPADLYAAIGPCISMKNFECGEDVISAISNMSVKDIPGAYTYNPERGKFYVSLPIVNKAVLYEYWHSRITDRD